MHASFRHEFEARFVRNKKELMEFETGSHLKLNSSHLKIGLSKIEDSGRLDRLLTTLNFHEKNWKKLLVSAKRIYHFTRGMK